MSCNNGTRLVTFVAKSSAAVAGYYRCGGAGRNHASFWRRRVRLAAYIWRRRHGLLAQLNHTNKRKLKMPWENDANLCLPSSSDRRRRDGSEPPIGMAKWPCEGGGVIKKAAETSAYGSPTFLPRPRQACCNIEAETGGRGRDSCRAGSRGVLRRCGACCAHPSKYPRLP